MQLTKGGSEQRVFLVGGAQAAGELDAKRAIDQVSGREYDGGQSDNLAH